MITTLGGRYFCALNSSYFAVTTIAGGLLFMLCQTLLKRLGWFVHSSQNPLRKILPPYQETKAQSKSCKWQSQDMSPDLVLIFFKNNRWRGTPIKLCSVSVELEGLMLVCFCQFIFTPKLFNLRSLCIVCEMVYPTEFHKDHIYSCTLSKMILLRPGEDFHTVLS